MLSSSFVVALIASGAYAAPQAGSSLTSAAASAGASATSAGGSEVSSATAAAASALSTVLGSWPSLDDIEKKLNLNDTYLNSLPPSAIMVPSYSNFTSSGWNVRFYGLVYKQPNVSTSDLDSIIDGLKTDNLNTTQQSLLQNRTSALAAIPISKANVSAIVKFNGDFVTPETGVGLNSADESGELDEFRVVQGLNGDKEVDGTKVAEVGLLDVEGPGNGTTILVPTSGISVISDIDDVLRITKVYVPNQGLYNSFVQPYVNVPGIPELFNTWNQSLPNVSFHYDTTTPLELTRTYVDYLFSNYPLGSLEMRPVNLSDPSQILDARLDSLKRLYESFPQRKFVLVGDTSSSTLLSAYPNITQTFPNQTQCIFIRNTSSTDSSDKIPYSTKEFQNVNSSQYFFYRTADDIVNLDVAGGQCVNSSVPQNVTFSEQGGVLGNAASARRQGNLLKALASSQKKGGEGDGDLRALLEQMQSARTAGKGADSKLKEEFQHSLEGVLLELRSVTMDNHDADAFLKQVSRIDYPDYYAKISKPMDLGTMLKNLKKGDYPTKRMFQDDLDLIWSNCLEYNSAENHPLRACALRLKRKADKLLQSITDIRERQNPDLDAVFPHSPSSGLGRAKVNGVAHAVPVVARTRTRTPSAMPRSRAGSGPVATVVGKKAEKDSLSYDAWIASPALRRSAEGMAHVRALEMLVDDAESGPDARARAIEALRDYIPPSHAHLLINSAAHSPMDVESDSGEVGEKRKANGMLEPERPVKRQRTDSPDVSVGFASKTEGPDPLDLWWAAQSSDLFLGNAMPPSRLLADSTPFPRPSPFPPQSVVSALPPLPTASASGSAAAAASLPTPAASQGTPTSSATAAPAQLAGKKRKRPRARAVPPPRETSLLARMNANINSIRRVRAAHARFAQIVEAGEDEAGGGGGGGGAIGGGGAGIDAPMEVEGGNWTLPGGPSGPHGVDIGSTAAESCMRWTSSKVLEHVGFEGTSKSALDTLGSVMGEYISNLGRTLVFYADKYSGQMSGEEIILHALFEGGVRSPGELEGYVREDVIRHGTRLGELEKKVHSAFGELGGGEALDDVGLFGEEGAEEEEDGAYVMGDTFDELGEDFLGFRELGIASEFNLQSNRIPAKLLKRRRAAAEKDKDKKDGPPPLPYPLPEPFEPLATGEIEEQIGLLQGFYQEKVARLMGPPPGAPLPEMGVVDPGMAGQPLPQLPPQPIPGVANIPGVLPPPSIPMNIPGVLPPQPPAQAPIPGVSFVPLAIPPPAFIPDDPIPTARSKVGPLGQIVSAKPPTAKKAKADAKKAEEAAAKAAAANAASNANAVPGPSVIAKKDSGQGGPGGKGDAGASKDAGGAKAGGAGGDEAKEKEKEKPPAPKKKKAAATQDNGLPKKRGRPPKNATVAHSPVVAASA
ncbi:unnamed protein product [Peniophora sp. CBMAI 1063]|nr:unnamed protein product [Peniophora sp. CBMAI 1063]